MIDAPALVGAWSISRELHDRVSGQRGTFDGELLVAPDEVGFTWRESGTLHWDGRTTAAGRELLLRQLDGQWWVTFRDGAPFHPWTTAAPVTHLCRADLYTGTLTAPDSSDTVHIEWDVTGPAKSQYIDTWLRRTGR